MFMFGNWFAKVSLEQPTVGAVAARAGQASWVGVLLKPGDTRCFIKQLSDRKIYHD